jgi:O-antigen ligase
MIYVPLCWFEIRFSPDLNRSLYGYYQNDFAQTRRYGGWRPVVFMDHGLAVGLWMCTSTLVGVMLWQSGWPRRVLGIPIALIAIVLGVTALFVKSFGALALLAMGLVVGTLAKQLRLPWLLVLLIMVPIGYVGARATGLWSGQQLIDLAAAIGGGERGGSLMVRINNETTHVAKALQQPLFGWGTFGRNRVSIQETGSRSITDALWLIVIGQRGVIGLIALMAMFLLPVVLFVSRWGRTGLSHPWLAPGAALCIVLIMFISDSLFNAFLNPVYLMAAGALMGLRADARTLAMMKDQSMHLDRARAASRPRAIPHDPAPGRARQPASPRPV